MKKFLTMFLAAAVTLGATLFGPGAARAEEWKPVVVLSLAGYDAIKSDLEMIGELSDSPQLANTFEGILGAFTNFQGLAGIDKSRPWGLALVTDAQDNMEMRPLAFLPADDIKKTFSALAQFIGEPQELDDNLYLLQAGPIPLYVKTVGKWAFIGQSEQHVEDAPEDPTAWLGGLNKQYDLAARVHVQNIPEFYRELAEQQIRLGAEQQMQAAAANPDADADQVALQQAMARQQIDAMVEGFRELDALTLGFAINEKTKTANLDVSLTAKAGTKLSAGLAAGSTDSRLAGFAVGDALLRLHASSQLSEDDSAKLLAAMKSMRPKVMEEIEQDAKLDTPELRNFVKQLLDELLDVVDETIEARHLNIGVSVIGEGPFTVLAGVIVADGTRLENIARRAAELIQNDPEAPPIKLDAAKHAGFNFHSLAVPDDAQDADMRKFLGESPELVAGFSKHAVFVAIGSHAIDGLKSVIDASAKSASGLPPFEALLSVGRAAAIAPDENADPQAQVALELLAQEKGQDHLRLNVTNIPNGQLFRLELEEGLLRTFGRLFKMGMNQ